MDRKVTELPSLAYKTPLMLVRVALMTLALSNATMESSPEDSMYTWETETFLENSITTDLLDIFANFESSIRTSLRISTCNASASNSTN
jgi:hypothetical protein